MPITIEMPKLSDTMTEGTLVRWIKKVGDNIAIGDVLAEVETDKATMEMEAFDEGVLTEIYVQDGNKVEVGQKLALLLGKGEKTIPRSESKPAARTNRPRKKKINPPGRTVPTPPGNHKERRTEGPAFRLKVSRIPSLSGDHFDRRPNQGLATSKESGRRNGH